MEERAKDARRGSCMLYLACRDRRVPWFLKAVAGGAPRPDKGHDVRRRGANEEPTTDLRRYPTPAEVAAYIGVAEEAVLEAIDAGAAYRASSLDAPRGVSGATGAETYGDNDPFIPRENIDEVEKAAGSLGDVEFYRYDAGHAFSNADAPSMYDKSSAETAWARTLDFFARHLG